MENTSVASDIGIAGQEPFNVAVDPLTERAEEVRLLPVLGVDRYPMCSRESRSVSIDDHTRRMPGWAYDSVSCIASSVTPTSDFVLSHHFVDLQIRKIRHCPLGVR